MEYTKSMLRFAPKFELTGYAVPRETKEGIIPSIQWFGGQVTVDSELLAPYLEERACVTVRGFLKADRGVKLGLAVDRVDLVPEDKVTKKIVGAFHAVSTDWVRLSPWKFTDDNGRVISGLAVFMDIFGGQLKFPSTIGDGIKFEPGAFESELQGVDLTTRNMKVRRGVESYEVLQIIPVRVYPIRPQVKKDEAQK